MEEKERVNKRRGGGRRIGYTHERAGRGKVKEKENEEQEEKQRTGGRIERLKVNNRGAREEARREYTRENKK